VRGQAEGILTAPRFAAKGATGETIAAHDWGAGTRLGHDGALEHIAAFVRDKVQDTRLIGVGHRVVHGGLTFPQPVRVDRTVLAAPEAFVPLAPLHQPHNLEPI
jgi:acetate kinase